MGVETIVRTLESISVSAVDLELADTGVVLENSVVFRVLFDVGGVKKLDHTISVPRNEPYTITGRESKPYRAAWSALCEEFGNPLPLLGPHLRRTYSENIPNALHIVGGFTEAYKEFLRLSGGIQIVNIGGQRNIRMTKLARMVDGFYHGLMIGDIQIGRT